MNKEDTTSMSDPNVSARLSSRRSHPRLSSTVCGAPDSRHLLTGARDERISRGGDDRSPLNDVEVLGRKVGLPGLAVGTIIAAGWSYKVPVVRLDCDGTAYNTLVSGYLVRWPSGEVALMPLDRLKRSDLLPIEGLEVSA